MQGDTLSARAARDPSLPLLSTRAHRHSTHARTAAAPPPHPRAAAARLGASPALRCCRPLPRHHPASPSPFASPPAAFPPRFASPPAASPPPSASPPAASPPPSASPSAASPPPSASSTAAAPTPCGGQRAGLCHRRWGLGLATAVDAIRPRPGRLRDGRRPAPRDGRHAFSPPWPPPGPRAGSGPPRAGSAPRRWGRGGVRQQAMVSGDAPPPMAPRAAAPRASSTEVPGSARRRPLLHSSVQARMPTPNKAITGLLQPKEEGMVKLPNLPAN